MQCPVDKLPMRTSNDFGKEIDICSSCLGVWFDDSELELFTRKFQVGQLEEFKKWKELVIASPPAEHFWQEPVRQCPRDGTEMGRHTFAGDSGAHIDRCFRCGGLWLDGGDVRRIMEYFQANPLHDAFARLIVRESEETARILNQLEYAAQEMRTFPHTEAVALWWIVARIVKFVGAILDDTKYNKV